MVGTQPEKLSELGHSTSRRQAVEGRGGKQLEHPFTSIERGLDAMIESLGPSVQTATATSALPLLVAIWIKAFIPLHVPGYTEPAPGWGGATMVNDPWIPGCWLTDNRGFSNDANASARMTSMFAVTVSTLAVNQLHYCDQTVKIDCDTGAVTCNAYGDASRMRYINPRGLPNVAFEIDLIGASSNPCPPLGAFAPDIDYNGIVAIDFVARQVLFQGNLDQFPAFEMYAMEYNSTGTPLFGIPMFNTLPPLGAGPGSLFGGANRPQIGFAQI